jgi:hypothetical protein
MSVSLNGYRFPKGVLASAIEAIGVCASAPATQAARNTFIPKDAEGELPIGDLDINPFLGALSFSTGTSYVAMREPGRESRSQGPDAVPAPAAATQPEAAGACRS